MLDVDDFVSISVVSLEITKMVARLIFASLNEKQVDLAVIMWYYILC